MSLADFGPIFNYRIVYYRGITANTLKSRREGESCFQEQGQNKAVVSKLAR